MEDKKKKIEEERIMQENDLLQKLIDELKKVDLALK